MEHVSTPDRVPPTGEKLDKSEDRRSARQVERQAEDVLKEATEILKDHGGLEANIPVHNVYWQLMNEYRALSREVSDTEAKKQATINQEVEEKRKEMEAKLEEEVAKKKAELAPKPPVVTEPKPEPKAK